MQVGEIAAATTRHQYFFTDLVRALKNDNTSTTLACHERAHETCRAAAEHYDVVFVHRRNIAGLRTAWTPRLRHQNPAFSGK